MHRNYGNSRWNFAYDLMRRRNARDNRWYPNYIGGSRSCPQSTKSVPRRSGARPKAPEPSAVPRSTCATASSISPAPAQVAETAAKHFAGQHDLVLLHVDAARLGDGAEMGALARRRAVSASLWRSRSGGGDKGRCAAAWPRRTAQVPAARSVSCASLGALPQHADTIMSPAMGRTAVACRSIRGFPMSLDSQTWATIHSSAYPARRRAGAPRASRPAPERRHSLSLPGRPAASC